MDEISTYQQFIQKKGKPLSVINPGSKEIALETDDALNAIELLKNSQLPILGGDVLTDDGGKLQYAYQSWGDEYISLNWYCSKQDNEIEPEYSDRSYKMAKKYIIQAKNVAKSLNRYCYIVLVI